MLCRRFVQICVLLSPELRFVISLILIKLVLAIIFGSYFGRFCTPFTIAPYLIWLLQIWNGVIIARMLMCISVMEYVVVDVKYLDLIVI
jgi:hypothetical protein